MYIRLSGNNGGRILYRGIPYIGDFIFPDFYIPPYPCDFTSNNNLILYRVIYDSKLRCNMSVFINKVIFYFSSVNALKLTFAELS